MYGQNCNLRTLSCEYNALPALALRELGTIHIVTGKLGQMSEGNMRQLETIKDKNITDFWL